MQRHTGLLGDFGIGRDEFSGLDALFKSFLQDDFLALPNHKKVEEVSRALLQLIQKQPERCFLLSSVLDYIERVDREKILHHYSFNRFELWLNQASGLSFEENFHVRAKIAGKRLERSDYQALFPIGMGKVYEGTHFVTAHRSPDLDTTVASFWGWLDAFAARVTDGLHVWNLPGGPPPSQIEIDWIFRDLFGEAVFSHLPRTRLTLNLSGDDLLSQKGFIPKTLDTPLSTVDHEREKNAVVLVDEEGFYLGDWRHLDVESVQQVIILLSTCIRWFENQLHLRIISLFAKKDLHLGEIEPLLQELFHLKLQDCEPAREFSLKQRGQVDKFLSKVLSLSQGLSLTFEELGNGLANLHEGTFLNAGGLIAKMQEEKLFDSKGVLLEDRPKIFHFLERTVKSLHETIFKIRSRLERLDIALKIKQDVFGHFPTFVLMNADVEEIRRKMGDYPYLTVTSPDQGRFFPVGIIPSAEFRKSSLGTVSLRDFCNRDEMGIPEYLDVISVIDHHKSVLATFSAPLAIIADAQSSNSLVAERAIFLNDRYSLLGQSISEIESQIAENGKDPRILIRLLNRRRAADQKGVFYVHPKREFAEYLHFLYAILDDTDLLSKVSAFDVTMVAELLNRLKSIASQREVEIVQLDDLPRDKSFPKKAAARILQNEDMYSLYRQIYVAREKEVGRNIELAASEKPSNLFADTKEQNGCCRVGQTKLFVKNIDLYERHANEIRRAWVSSAKKAFEKNSEIDLHIHMISTIVSAEEVYRGAQAPYKHRDEMWIWIPGTELSKEHLKSFLASFQNSPGLNKNPVTIEFLGAKNDEMETLFKESFLDVPTSQSPALEPKTFIIVLKYNPGSLNSRKAMVSPFLPTL